QVPIVVEKTSNSKFYALFLLVGLLLGGGLVLATLLAARFINRPTEANISIQTKTGENKTQKTPEIIERDNDVDKLADELHRKKVASRPDEDFNGRVIVENANVRSAPNANASQIDILPDGDRIEIERRESGGSPWYYVTCEHGISGWMHGNTIEFTNGNF
ncbi:MAG: SH3 domain-containing protein, partial [Pyrinomonadaceae bacterium]